MENKKTDFSAKEPSLGYFYQVQYALLLLLLSDQESDGKILIENLDDIEFHKNEEISLFQLKYHAKGNTNLTDRSTDFWKTIRVWCEQIYNNNIKIENTIFSLISTENISNKSILLNLKLGKNLEDVLVTLNEISKEIDNDTNKKGYDAFNKLSKNQKEELLKKIKIIDSSYDFTDMEKQIKNEIKFVVTPKNIDSLLERLYGWWLQQSILHLQNKKQFISFKELQNQIINITDQFKKDNLPLDFPDKVTLSKNELKEKESMVFVKQLNIIDASERMKQNSISDYYRAYNQRSKWLREDLLNPEEEINYEKKLREDWSRKFDILLDDVEHESESKKKQNGNLFFKKFYYEKSPEIFIRERFNETFLVTGSCHMLSDKRVIGWHPDFEKMTEEKSE
jgi:hypothetical protein